MNADAGNMEPMEWAKFVLRNRNEKGYSRAYNIFMTSARDGNAEAEYNLGLMYARGQGVPKDYKAALSWFQKAHDHGNRAATYFLGKMYVTGVGVEKDSRQAEKLFMKCVDEDVRARLQSALNQLDGSLSMWGEYFDGVAEMPLSSATIYYNNPSAPSYILFSGLPAAVLVDLQTGG